MAKTKIATFFGYDFSNREIEKEVIPLEDSDTNTEEANKAVSNRDTQKGATSAASNQTAQAQKAQQKAKGQVSVRFVDTGKNSALTKKKSTNHSGNQEMQDADDFNADSFQGGVIIRKAAPAKNESDKPKKKEMLTPAEIAQLMANPTPANLVKLQMSRAQQTITEDQYLGVANHWLRSNAANSATMPVVAQTLGFEALKDIVSLKVFRILVDATPGLDSSLTTDPNSVLSARMNEYLNKNKRAVLAQILGSDSHPASVSKAMSLIERALSAVILENQERGNYTNYYGQPSSFVSLSAQLNNLSKSANAGLASKARSLLDLLGQISR